MTMAGKSKLQLSRLLAEKLDKIFQSPEECELNSIQTKVIYILGFHYGNVSNYVGLTTDYKNHDSGLIVNGLLFLKELPDASEIKGILESVSEHYNAYVGNFAKIDKNCHLYLIAHKSEDSNQVCHSIYNLTDGSFLVVNTAVTVLDDAKIYLHSALTKIVGSIKLPIYESAKKLLDQDRIDLVIQETANGLSKNVMVHLSKSNFSTNNPLENNTVLESLYSNLDVPKEVEQMGDYLPQMTKEEKKKLQSKWRNKIKDQRGPLEIQLEFGDLSGVSSTNSYDLNLEEFFYLQVNDPISKCIKQIVYLIRQKLQLLRSAISSQCQADRVLESNEMKFCSFKPKITNHIIQAVYLLASERDPMFDHLKAARGVLHQTYLLPMNEPHVRYSQRIENVDLKNQDQLNGYLCNVHRDIANKSGIKGATLLGLVGGTYTYHHYMQDRSSDNGWGCAYRSLQTIISWFKHQAYIYSPDVGPRNPANKKEDKTAMLRLKLHRERRVPTHEEIQQVLVDVGDKQASFVGSTKWIGSQEVCFVLDHLFNIESKFISVSSGSELAYKARDLVQHFGGQSTPVMIGGGVLAHTIIGIDFNEKNGDISYLILDPHYTGAEDMNVITKKGWCGWKKNSFWDKSAFYNLCLPQRPDAEY